MHVPAGVQLSDSQLGVLRAYAEELQAMNQRINLVSREDVARVERVHIPHCLTIATRAFHPGTVVVDWGTGGGLPLIPLAVAMPEVSFIGVDAVAKKVQAVRHFARRLGLTNVDAWHGRAEAFDSRVDYSVSRATAPLGVLWGWHQRVAEAVTSDVPESGEWPRGSLVCLKGGELEPEIDQTSGDVIVERWSIARLLPDPYFDTKEIVCVSPNGDHG
jgi:16S rRNA (guanine527-N7)-methyltransferase